MTTQDNLDTLRAIVMLIQSVPGLRAPNGTLDRYYEGVVRDLLRDAATLTSRLVADVVLTGVPPIAPSNILAEDVPF